MMPRYTDLTPLIVAVMAAFLVGQLPVTDCFLTVSPPSGSRCLTRSTLIDPSSTSIITSRSSSSSSTNAESEIAPSQSPILEQHNPVSWTLLNRLFDSIDSKSTGILGTSGLCGSQQHQNPLELLNDGTVVSLLSQCLSTVVESIKSQTSLSSSDTSRAATTDNLLIQVGDWQAYQCQAKRDSKYSYASGHVYYFNARTGVSQWEKPYDDFPTPTVPIVKTDPFYFLSQRESSSFNTPSTLSTTALWATSRMDEESSSSQGSGSTKEKQSWWDMMVQVQTSVSKAFQFINTERKTSSVDMRSNDANTANTNSWWSFLFDKSDERSGQGVLDANRGETTRGNDSSWGTFWSSWGESNSNSNTVERDPESRPDSSATTGNNAPWEILFRSDDKKSSSPQRYVESDQGDLLLDKDRDGASMAQQRHQSPRYTDWVENLSLYLTKDSSRTRTLFSVKNVPVLGPILTSEKAVTAESPSVSDPTMKKSGTPTAVSSSAAAAAREKALQEKRYAASVARQANLRKNYDEVVLDRSPTISLTAMKKSHKPEVRNTWFRYLED